MSRKKDRTEEAHDFSGLPAPKAVTAADIQAKEFGVSRFGGYKMRDVDEFLDELTASMTRLTEENERLRAGAGIPAAPIGAPDLVDSARQADEIIERARAEAARIVRDAEDRAATTAAGGASGADRAAVAAFLARERDFLQSLATLVQGHAEAIKGMARASRPASASPNTPASGTSAAVAPAAAASAPAPIEVPAAEATDAPATDEPSAQASEAAAPQEEPIRVDEPAAATVVRGEGEDDPEAMPAEGDRSLRELFWGED